MLYYLRGMELCERTECQIDFSAGGDKRVPPLVKITDIAQEFHVDSPAAQIESVFAQQSFQSTSICKLMRKSTSVSSNSSTDDNFTFLPEDLANLDVYAVCHKFATSLHNFYCNTLVGFSFERAFTAGFTSDHHLSGFIQRLSSRLITSL